jgi:hypothetical protein
MTTNRTLAIETKISVVTMMMMMMKRNIKHFKKTVKTFFRYLYSDNGLF